MAYSARNWNDGELVQAVDMNRIEQGIEDAEGAAGGLADRLSAVEYDSGWRNITSTLAEAPQSGRVLLRRNGKIVHLHVDALTYSSDASFKSWGPVIPSGFRPPAELDIAAGRRLATDTGGSIRINRVTGNGFAYQVVANFAIRASGSWVTDESTPTTLPGAPA